MVPYEALLVVVMAAEEGNEESVSTAGVALS